MVGHGKASLLKRETARKLGSRTELPLEDSLEDFLLFHLQHLRFRGPPRLELFPDTRPSRRDGVIVLVLLDLACVCCFARRTMGHVSFDFVVGGGAGKIGKDRKCHEGRHRTGERGGVRRTVPGPDSLIERIRRDESSSWNLSHLRNPYRNSTSHVGPLAGFHILPWPIE